MIFCLSVSSEKRRRDFLDIPTNEGYVRRMIRVFRPEIYRGKRTDPKLGEIISARAGVERSINNALQLLPEIHPSKNLKEGIYYNLITFY